MSEALKAEAERLGFVNRLVEPGEALDAAIALAEQICANAPVAVRESRKIVLEDYAAKVDIGFHDFERGNPQRLLLTVEVVTGTATHGCSDHRSLGPIILARNSSTQQRASSGAHGSLAHRRCPQHDACPTEKLPLSPIHLRSSAFHLRPSACGYRRRSAFSP